MAIYGIFEKQLGKTMQKHKENFKITIAVRDIDKNVFCTTFSGLSVEVCLLPKSAETRGMIKQ